jgi:hypothetical protein
MVKDEHGVRREWSVECLNEEHSLDTCAIEANTGRIAIYHDETAIFELTPEQYPAFRAALEQAYWRVSADVVSGRG